jgi:hypothetical protein
LFGRFSRFVAPARSPAVPLVRLYAMKRGVGL